MEAVAQAVPLDESLHAGGQRRRQQRAQFIDARFEKFGDPHGLTGPGAQFGAPFGVPGALTVPEAATGALSAGAANSLRQQQQCQQTFAGRDGPRTICAPPSPPPMQAPHR